MIRSFFIALSITLIWILPSVIQGQQSEFGSSSEEEGALIGILYDLKQDQQGRPSDVTELNYRDVLGEFLASDWDEHILSKYFRVSRPVYATRICIPIMQAVQAPESFGVAEVVEPRLWVVHYKGQVVAPMDGVYRLAGYADDFIAARINGKTVLMNGRTGSIPRNYQWENPGRFGMRVGNGRIRYGHWLTLKKGEVIDLDVLIGERPGGGFGAWLYVEREGETYPSWQSFPILPLLQLLDEDIEISGNFRAAPPRESSVWKALK